MTASRSLSLPLIGLLLLVAAACDDGTSPANLGDLDPVAVAAAVDRLNAPVVASRPALTNLRKAIPSLTAAGVQFDRAVAARFTAAFRAVSLAPPAPPVALVIPPEAAGETFIYDPAVSAWVMDETREGAPADGIRVIWYAVDGSSEIALPVTERGYIDLTPGENTPAAPVGVRIVDTGAAPLTLMDFGQWHDTVTVGTEESEDFGAAGFYADSATTVDFTILSTQAVDTVAGDEAYELDITLEDPETAYTLELWGVVDGSSGTYEDFFSATVVASGGTTVMEITFDGVNDVQNHSGGTLTHDAEVVVDIVDNGSAFEFTRPGGGGLPAGQASELNLLFTSLTVTGYNLIYRIPLFFLL